MDVLGALAALILDFMASAPGVPGVLLYTLVASIPLTLLHEMGHALVARRRLRSEVRVVVGTSGRLAELRLFGVSVSLRALARPGCVAGYAQYDATYATRRDVALIALGGPAASLAGFGICAWALAVAPDVGIAHGALWALTLGGAVASVVNLVPMTLRERRDGPIVRTDGRIALDCLRAARTTTPRREPAARRKRATSAATPGIASTTTGHLPLRGRGGAALGGEPVTRTSVPAMADDDLARRARRLATNRGRSIPPPSRRYDWR
jgi:hypothetical protein